MSPVHHTTTKLCALAAAALLAACGSTTDLTEKAAPVETRTPTAAAPSTGTGSSGATAATTTPQSQVTTVDLAKDDSATAKAPRIVYFDFDSFVIKDDFKPMIESNARALASARNKKITIEGHTDERGGSEYNLALGQKRAEAVARSLALLGVQESQIEAVSFGKERPAVTGSNETAWAQNRRAELKDR